jgi:hypothetical protein
VVCEDLTCIAGAGAPSPTPATFAGPVDLTVTGLIGAPSAPAWRGGVLLNDGSILLTPAMASQFVILPPGAASATAVTHVGIAMEPPPRFGAAVLGCDGYVYALPDKALSLWKIDPNFLIATPMAFDAGSITGAVVSGSCADGLVHITASSAGTGLDIAISADRVMSVTSFPAGAPATAPQGVARAGSVFLMPNPSCFTVDKVAGYCSPSLGADGGTVYFGGAYAGAGAISVFNGSDGGYVETYNGNGLAFAGGLTTPGAQWPLARGDGYIYGATATKLIAVDPFNGSEWDLAITIPNPGIPNGMINAENGDIVATLDGLPKVRVFHMGPTPNPIAPMKLLLSPYFNKR